MVFKKQLDRLDRQSDKRDVEVSEMHLESGTEGVFIRRSCLRQPQPLLCCTDTSIALSILALYGQSMELSRIFVSVCLCLFL